LPDGPDAIPDIEASDIQNVLVADERRLSLIHAFFRLSPRQTDVIIARFLGEHSLGQIAHLLHMAQGTVKATLAQALDRLRVLLEHHNIDEWF
jgi:RNA polymerase sigma factor (sigma-70 family)